MHSQLYIAISTESLLPQLTQSNSSLAFKNVRDGAICKSGSFHFSHSSIPFQHVLKHSLFYLITTHPHTLLSHLSLSLLSYSIVYLCDGRIGPVYPHELALQAQEGQARRYPAAARDRDRERAVTAGPAATTGTGNPYNNEQAHRHHRHAYGPGHSQHGNQRAEATAVPPASTSAAAAARTSITTGTERSRASGAASVRTSNPASTATARAARASRRSRRQTNEVTSSANANGRLNEEEAQEVTPHTTVTAVEADKEIQGANGIEEGEDDNEHAPGPSSRTGSSSSIRVKRELIEDHDAEEIHAFEREDIEANNTTVDPYFKRRRLAN